MDKIKEQASLVSQLLFSAETGDLYKKTLARTWDIVRELGLLLWLVICLTFVGGEWFYRTAVDLGRSTRVWYAGLSESSTTDATEPTGSTGEALLETVKSGTTYLLSRARQQLGLPEPEPKPMTAVPPTPPTVSTPARASAATPAIPATPATASLEVPPADPTTPTTSPLEADPDAEDLV
jgi:hypothetical protein